MLVGTAEVVGVKHALIVRRSCRATRRLEKNSVFLVGIIRRLSGRHMAGLWSLSRFGRGRLSLQLLQSQVVSVLPILARHGIAQLLQAFRPDAKLLCNCLFGGIVGEEDEGFKSCVGVLFLVDAPQNVAEEGLKIDGDGPL
jgi:hypothetical protein